jgi:hypothetical protein
MGIQKVPVYLDPTVSAERNWGETRMYDDGQLSVHLHPDMPPQLFWVTFWHEIGHVAEREKCLEIPHALVDAFGHWAEEMFRTLEWFQDPPPHVVKRSRAKKKPSKKKSRSRS